MDITRLISTVSTTGIVGVILAISMWANYLLYKENKDLQEKRVQDAQNYQQSILQPMKTLQSTLDLIVTIINKAK